jgi:hypothetical protein
MAEWLSGLKGNFLGGCSLGENPMPTRAHSSFGRAGERVRQEARTTHSLPLRREAPGRGTPAAPRSAQPGPSLQSTRRRGRGRWRGAARTWARGARAAASRDSAQPALRRRGAWEPERWPSSRGRRGPPAPSPQPPGGSDNEDISRKLLGAGGRARREREGVCQRPSKCGQVLPLKSPKSCLSFLRNVKFPKREGRGERAQKDLQRAGPGDWVVRRTFRTQRLGSPQLERVERLSWQGGYNQNLEAKWGLQEECRE